MIEDPQSLERSVDAAPVHSEAAYSASYEGSVLIITHDLQPEANRELLAHIANAFAGFPVMVAIPDVVANESTQPSVESTTWNVVSYASTALPATNWSVSAAEFRNVFDLLKSHPARITMVLGAEANSLSGEGLRGLYNEAASTGCDLITAEYSLPSRSGLVNSGILYPLSRALFGASPRFPLAVDACLSVRMVERLFAAASSPNKRDQLDPFIWPVSEAIAAGFRVGQYNVGYRSVPQPASLDVNEIINQVVGSCFADIEAKASVWQRLRMAPSSQSTPSPSQGHAEVANEVIHLIDGFRLAYTNLLDVWKLVLPPQALLGLKRLSAAPPSAFALPDPLWARIVYDFVLAFRLRTLNRNHLLGSLTPLYLAWLASHLSLTARGVDPEEHIQQMARAFEAEKSYLVARWRWPDRFNP